MRSLQELLTEFSTLAEKHPGPIPDSISLIDADSLPFALHFSLVVHGDEFGTLPGAIRFINAWTSHRDLKTRRPKVVLTLGNRKAYLAGRRFIEHDMNRLFDPDQGVLSDEHGRAGELMTVIRSSNLLIDFHQSIEPTAAAFFVLNAHPKTALWGTALDVAELALVRSATSHLPRYKTATQYAESCGIPGLTLEVSQKGLSTNGAQLTYQAMTNAVVWAGQLQTSAFPVESKLKCYEIDFYQDFDGPKCQLRPGIKNLTEVQQGEVLGHSHAGAELRAPFSGIIVFPKYPARDTHGSAQKPYPPHIFGLAKSVDICLR